MFEIIKENKKNKNVIKKCIYLKGNKSGRVLVDHSTSKIIQQNKHKTFWQKIVTFGHFYF